MTTVFAAALVASIGCQSVPPQNRGTSGARLDPTRDSIAEDGVLQPRSRDLVEATDQMAQDLAQRLDIVNRTAPPTIFVGRIENQSSLPYQEFQVYLARLRATLQSSGAREGIRFVRERDFVEDQRAREYGDNPTVGPDAYRSRADYVLTCEVYDLPAGGTNYFLFDYQLVQLREAIGGPDLGPGAIVWEKGYEVKYQ